MTGCIVFVRAMARSSEGTLMWSEFTGEGVRHVLLMVSTGVYIVNAGQELYRLYQLYQLYSVYY